VDRLREVDVIIYPFSFHPNWWKGSNQRGEGLFPSNFVTADLSVEPEEFTSMIYLTNFLMYSNV